MVKPYRQYEAVWVVKYGFPPDLGRMIDMEPLTKPLEPQNPMSFEPLKHLGHPSSQLSAWWFQICFMMAPSSSPSSHQHHTHGTCFLTVFMHPINLYGRLIPVGSFGDRSVRRAECWITAVDGAFGGSLRIETFPKEPKWQGESPRVCTSLGACRLLPQKQLFRMNLIG